MKRREFLAWGTVTFPLTWAGKVSDKVKPPRRVRVPGLPLLTAHHLKR